MSKENKNTLCKICKEIDSKKDIARYADILLNPGFVCKKCLRMANSEDFLCKAVPFKKVFD